MLGFPADAKFGVSVFVAVGAGGAITQIALKPGALGCRSGTAGGYGHDPAVAPIKSPR